jgi:hypothetical protein
MMRPLQVTDLKLVFDCSQWSIRNAHAEASSLTDNNWKIQRSFSQVSCDRREGTSSRMLSNYSMSTLRKAVVSACSSSRQLFCITPFLSSRPIRCVWSASSSSWCVCQSNEFRWPQCQGATMLYGTSVRLCIYLSDGNRLNSPRTWQKGDLLFSFDGSFKGRSRDISVWVLPTEFTDCRLDSALVFSLWVDFNGKGGRRRASVCILLYDSAVIVRQSLTDERKRLWRTASSTHRPTCSSNIMRMSLRRNTPVSSKYNCMSRFCH